MQYSGPQCKQAKPRQQTLLFWGKLCQHITVCKYILHEYEQHTDAKTFQQSQALSWYETKQVHCVKSKPPFSGTGYRDKTAVQLMSDCESLPAVCNCCCTVVYTESGNQVREEKRREESGPRSAGSCLMISNNL